MKNLILALPFLFSSLALASYEDHFPAYYEYCSGTQWKLQSGDVGGSPGHGFNYIHGLCKDYRSAYPQVIPCSEVEPHLLSQYPHEGVGVSLDKNYSNVSWVAVPGRDLMYFGKQKRKAIGNEDVEAIVRKITDLRVFHDVVMKPAQYSSMEVNSPEYLRATALDTLGTDYAVNWARELHCVRIPVPSTSLKPLADYLNKANSQYRTGVGYQWDKIKNNCTHLAINMGHILGINKAILTDRHILRQLFNLALPSNTFLMYADLAVLNKLSSRKLKKSVEQDSYHPLQLGSLVMKYEVYPSGERFSTDDLTVLTLPRILKPLRLFSTPRKYEKYFSPDRTELVSNAETWLERYSKFYNKLKPDERSSAFAAYLQKQISLAEDIIRTEN